MNEKPLNILVTGAKGFVGTNLVENLKALRDGKNRTRPNLSIGEIFEYDRESTVEELDDYCARADFVFNLAGVNRPKDTKEFEKGNFGFASTLLNTLKKQSILGIVRFWKFIRNFPQKEYPYCNERLVWIWAKVKRLSWQMKNNRVFC